MMKPSHLIETALLHGAAGVLGALPRPAALALGEGLGSLLHGIGLRAKVARANLARAFPEQDEAWRERLLAEHYRELGRTAADYAHMRELVRAPREQTFARYTGLDTARVALALGKGIIFISGHLGFFELLGAALSDLAPVAFVVKPMSNPGAEAWLSRLRRDCGIEPLPIGAGIRTVIKRLRAGGIVCMVGDQDARRDGVFVPFFGVPSSTPTGPAWLALQTGAPVVFGTCLRAPDGRFFGHLDAMYLPPGEASDPEAVRALTAWHTARLERTVRERPESWFWLHKRWKTAPPTEEA